MGFPALGFLALVALAHGAESLRDATGVVVDTDRSAKRVVTLAPSLAEVAAQLLGETDCTKIVGVSEYSVFPTCVVGIKTVGAFHQVRLESILALDPDLILATKDGNAADTVARLRAMGRRVVVVSTTSLSEIEQSFSLVGAALGLSKKGNALALEFRKRVSEFDRSSAVSPKQKPKIFLQVGADPLVTVGSRGFLPEAFEKLGVNLLFPEMVEPYPRPTVEEVIRRKPEKIWILSMGTDTRLAEKWAGDWKRFKTLSVVKENKVEVIDGNELTIPTFRLLGALDRLRKKLLEESR